MNARKKLCLLSLLKIKLNDTEINLSDFSMNWDQYESTTFSNCIPIPVTITEKDITVSNESIPVITYVGGYCCYTIDKLKCDA